MATESRSFSDHRLAYTATGLLETAPAPRHRRPRTGQRPADTATLADLAATAQRLHVISEPLFRGALIRERKTADRTSQPFRLLLVKYEGPSSGASAVWDDTIAALGFVKQETDVMGWFEERKALGVLLHEVGPFRGPLTEDLEPAVRGALVQRLGAEAASRFSIQLLVHHEARSANGNHAVDPLLDEMRSRENENVLYGRIKRAVDIVGSLMLLAILSPVFLVVALLVKMTSEGPVFFRQKRIGKNAEPFNMLKFRSMTTNADHAAHQDYVTWFIKSSSQATETGGSQVFKLVNDKRITPLGHILRRTSLDELPQLYNVLRGDMSLVGPRPPLPYEVEQYQSWHVRRVLEAKPGITGLWQVTGRSRTTFDEMVRLDLRYAKSCSLWTDVKILLATPRAVFTGKGAC